MAGDLEMAAFVGQTLLARGRLGAVLTRVKNHLEADPEASILIFEDATGKQLEFDLRGDLPTVLERAGVGREGAEGEARQSAGRGRPRMGVVSREISLLPRHWEWLEAQPRTASATIRRLVDEARSQDPEGERRRAARDSAGRFLTAMAGNLPSYEEATRALYAGDPARFKRLIKPWPVDVRRHALRLALPSFPGEQDDA